MEASFVFLSLATGGVNSGGNWLDDDFSLEIFCTPLKRGEEAIANRAEYGFGPPTALGVSLQSVDCTDLLSPGDSEARIDCGIFGSGVPIPCLGVVVRIASALGAFLLAKASGLGAFLLADGRKPLTVTGFCLGVASRDAMSSGL